MKYRLWPGLSGVLEWFRLRSSRLGTLRRASPPGAGSGADLDQWVRLASGDDLEPGAGLVGPPSADLLCRVQLVLEDDEASLLPPVAAGDLTQVEWDAMPEHARAPYQRRQLDRLDPRLIPRTTKLAAIAGRLRR
jgi:hypothetical protein